MQSSLCKSQILNSAWLNICLAPLWFGSYVTAAAWCNISQRRIDSIKSRWRDGSVTATRTPSQVNNGDHKHLYIKNTTWLLDLWPRMTFQIDSCQMACKCWFTENVNMFHTYLKCWSMRINYCRITFSITLISLCKQWSRSWPWVWTMHVQLHSVPSGHLCILTLLSKQSEHLGFPRRDCFTLIKPLLTAVIHCSFIEQAAVNSCLTWLEIQSLISASSSNLSLLQFYSPGSSQQLFNLTENEKRR